MTQVGGILETKISINISTSGGCREIEFMPSATVSQMLNHMEPGSSKTHCLRFLDKEFDANDTAKMVWRETRRLWVMYRIAPRMERHSEDVDFKVSLKIFFWSDKENVEGCIEKLEVIGMSHVGTVTVQELLSSVAKNHGKLKDNVLFACIEVKKDMAGDYGYTRRALPGDLILQQLGLGDRCIVLLAGWTIKITNGVVKGCASKIQYSWAVPMQEKMAVWSTSASLVRDIWGLNLGTDRYNYLLYRQEQESSAGTGGEITLHSVMWPDQVVLESSVSPHGDEVVIVERDDVRIAERLPTSVLPGQKGTVMCWESRPAAMNPNTVTAVIQAAGEVAVEVAPVLVVEVGAPMSLPAESTVPKMVTMSFILGSVQKDIEAMIDLKHDLLCDLIAKSFDLTTEDIVVPPLPKGKERGLTKIVVQYRVRFVCDGCGGYVAFTTAPDYKSLEDAMKKERQLDGRVRVIADDQRLTDDMSPEALMALYKGKELTLEREKVSGVIKTFEFMWFAESEKCWKSANITFPMETTVLTGISVIKVTCALQQESEIVLLSCGLEIDTTEMWGSCNASDRIYVCVIPDNDVIYSKSLVSPITSEVYLRGVTRQDGNNDDY